MQPTPVFLPGKSHGWRSLVGYSAWGLKELDTTERLHFRIHTYLGFPGGSVVKNSPVSAGDAGLIPGQEDTLEKEIATHSSILAWRIPQTEELGRLQSMGSQE